MLDRTVHLASCSLGARSVDLDAALTAMLTAMAEHGAPWHDFEQQAELARRQFAELIGARADQVALVPNASVGAYQVASTVDIRDRPGIVVSMDEFPSLSHVWLAQRARGAEVEHVRGADYAGAVDHRTALVSVPMTTYRDGLRMPVAETVALAHAAGARVFVDALPGTRRRSRWTSTSWAATSWSVAARSTCSACPARRSSTSAPWRPPICRRC